MRSAQQADVVGPVIASQAEGMPVMQLEPVSLGAAPACFVDEATAVLVAFAHGATHGGWNVA